MSNKKETIILQIPESFTFGNYKADDFDRVLSFFDWSLENRNLVFKSELNTGDEPILLPYFLFFEWAIRKKCNVKIDEVRWNGLFSNNSRLSEILSLKESAPHESGASVFINNSGNREQMLKLVEDFVEEIDVKYTKPLRYIINELLYNTLEHGRNGYDLPSALQFIWNKYTNELSFIVADVGVGIRKHLRQTYPNLATDCEAILHSLKPQISGTFGRSNTGYETKNNAGVGLFFSSNIAQRLNADMFIVSGNGFVHISPTEIISKELQNQWKGTFVYVKIKLGLIVDLNLQKMLSEITKTIPKTDKVTEENNLYISVRNYFGRYAEDKDKAKKIRDEKLLPALNENKTLTIDFEEIVSAPHSLLNAMLATPIERLGLAAYKKIKIINAAPDIRETLDFIFDDNTSNA